MRWVIAILALCFFTVSSAVDAQNPLPAPIIIEGGMSYGTWSYNNSFVYKTQFEERGVKTSSPSWFAYDVSTQSLIRSNTWLLHPLLTSQQYLSLEISGSYDHPTYTYISPDSRFLVYMHNSKGENHSSPLALANLLTGEFFVTDISIYSNNPTEFSILWNNQSSAFAVKIQTPYGGTNIYYVSGFVSNIEVLTSQNLQTITIENSDYITFDVYDVSSDGNTLLLSAGSVASDRNLLTYDVVAPANYYSYDVSGSNITGAAFHPIIDDAVLFVNDVGITEYKYVINQIRTIDNTINSTWIDKVYFSPDRLWLAALTLEKNGNGELFIVPTVTTENAIPYSALPITPCACGGFRNKQSAIDRESTGSLFFIYPLYANPFTWFCTT